MDRPCFVSTLLAPLRARPHTHRSCSNVRSGVTPMMTAFRKYHGLGNDFVLIDNRNSSTPTLDAQAAAALCDRHTGVGADGVIFMLPAREGGSDFAMRLFNSDGSEPEMCGNGIRCLARFANDLGVKPSTDGSYRVDTLAGLIVPSLLQDGGGVRVDMGVPILQAPDVPTTLSCVSPSFVDTMVVDGREWSTSAVSMGNPHSVIFVDKSTYWELDETLEVIGPQFESHAVFPAKTNTEFVLQIDDRRLRMLVWERGAGRTRACGTGACAVVVAGVLTGRVARGSDVVVELPGGELVIQWAPGADGHVFMTGPAELVYSGELAQTTTAAAAALVV